MERLGRKAVDLLVVGSMLSGSLGATENLSSRLVDRLGLEAASALRVEAASATGAAAFHAACWAVQSGAHHRALVIAGDKMTDWSTPEVAAALARSLASGESRSGATMPGLAALVTQLYLDRYHVGPAGVDAVSVQARAHAALNPNAQFQRAVTPREVAESRPIALPLRLLHCSAVSDGAAAVVVERGSGPATVLGLGQGLDRLALIDRDTPTSFRATRLAARQAYERSHLTRKEVDFAEVHDAFAPFAFLDMEDLGFCGAGESPAWFLRGDTDLGGRLPMNPSGGLLGRGHPVGASGLVQVAEVARQLFRESGPTQVTRGRVGLAQSIGGLGSHNFVTLLGPKGAN
jgi:acetyl-CoA C-acetyltransferase